MPELPEVETVRLTLEPVLGRRVAKVWTSGISLRKNRAGSASALRRAAVGGRIESVRRFGKYLFVDFAGRDQSLLVHLGMTGRFRLHARRDERVKHTHVIFELDRGDLRYTDARRFGYVGLVTRGQEREHPALAPLGVDPIVDGIDGALLHDGFRSMRRALKVALLDQKVVAGVGNIYASEALWRARIRPTLLASKLSKPRCTQLADSISAVLDHALSRGGTSLRDFVAADGASGENAPYLDVYGRGGQPCPRRGCDGHIRRTMIQGRATFHCPRCQRR